jgi:hypothetical protein
MNRWVVWTIIVVLGGSVLLLGGSTFTIVTRSSFEATSTPIPGETRIDNNFYYFELDHNLAIPVGVAGKCDERFYRVIHFRERDSVVCIAPKEIIEKYRKELDVFNRKALIYSVLKKLNPGRYSCIFFVRPSAFDFYHEVVKTVSKLGFDVMWFPLENFQPIVFDLGNKRLEIRR